MRISFTFKLSLLIILLTLVVTGGTLTYFYNHTKDLILEEVRGRLSNLAHSGTYMFRAEDRELITLFRDQLFTEFAELDADELTVLENEARQFLSKQAQDEYHASYLYQHLVQLLRQVQFGSSQEVRPVGALPQSISGSGQQDPGIQWVYLMAQNPQLKSQGLVAFLADTYYEKLDKGPEPNPIGNVYAGDPALFVQPFVDGEIAVSDGWYSDQWGTFMTAVVPIKNASGEVIASLGLDYSVGERAKKLDVLFNFCLSLFGVAFALAVLASFILAGVINMPIDRLRRGADRFSRRDFSKPINVRSRDEFGVLASTLNTMALEIRDYSAGLEDLVQKRTSELSTASDKILQLNEKLESEKNSLGAEVDIAKGLQQQMLPGRDDLTPFTELVVATGSESADLVGGDYFDVIATGPNRGWFSIGDVTGHGLETGVMMLMLRTAIRAVLDTGSAGGSDAGPEAQYQRINRLVYDDVQRQQSEKHATLSLLHYDGGGAFTVAGQHQDLLVIRDRRRVENLDTTGLGLPLGLIDDISLVCRHLTVRLAVGQSLVLHTNGITQAENAAGQFYGLDRLMAQLQLHGAATPENILAAVMADVKDHLDGLPLQDDLTLLIIRRAR
jgi:serine phosphatase RsbU (regulator of sigma subunit)